MVHRPSPAFQARIVSGYYPEKRNRGLCHGIYQYLRNLLSLFSARCRVLDTVLL